VTSTGVPTILFVATPGALGGSNRSLLTVMGQLEGKAHRVLASPGMGSFIDVVTAEGLADELVMLPRKPRQKIDRWLRLIAGTRLAWWALRNRKRLTAIHANALTGLNLATMASLVTQKTTVVWIHDPVGSKWGKRLGPVLRRLLPKLRLAAVSPTAESVAVENGLCDEGDATIVPNPIEVSEVAGLWERKGEMPLHVGFVGGATPRKGFDLLPAAVAALEDRPITWKLYVSLEPRHFNEGTWARLRLHDSDVVDPVGKLSDVRQVYADLDIVFIPSRAESFCRVAAEAMLNGIPVVGSDIEPLRALLGDDEAGLLFPSEDVDAAGAALRKLIDDSELRAQLGAAGMERAHRFAPNSITEQLMELYGIV